MKPKQIARKLRVTPDFVYRTMEKIKHELKTKVLNPKEPLKPGTKKTRNDEKLLTAIAECLE